MDIVKILFLFSILLMVVAVILLLLNTKSQSKLYAIGVVFVAISIFSLLSLAKVERESVAAFVSTYNTAPVITTDDITVDDKTPVVESTEVQ